jgi:hypothetical protein
MQVQSQQGLVLGYEGLSVVRAVQAHAVKVDRMMVCTAHPLGWHDLLVVVSCSCQR